MEMAQLVEFNDDWETGEKQELWTRCSPRPIPRGGDPDDAQPWPLHGNSARGKDDTTGVGLVEVYVP